MASPEAHAIALHREGDTEGAFQAYHKLVNNGTRDYRIYINLAVLLKHRNHISESQRLLEHALRIGIKHAFVFNNLANIYVQKTRVVPYPYC